MTLATRQASGTKRAANLRVHTIAGVQNAAAAFIRTGAGLIQFLNRFTISVNSTGTDAGYFSGGTALITTRDVVVTVTGTLGTVTYAWSQVSGDAGITINSPAAASTSFSATLAPGDTLTGVFKCHVSDTSGHSGDSPNVTVGLHNRYGTGLL